LVVTHDPLEAMLISDRIILINNGKLVQQGSTSDLYFKPISKFVAGFFGNINIFDGSIINGKLNFLMGEVSELNLKDSSSVDVVIRNEGISLKLEKTDKSVQAKIENIRNLGYYYKIDIRLISKQIITSHMRYIDGMFVGSEIWAEFDPSLMYIFYKENG
jgi:ABC-type spermidine/putrescine transport systems, ATPase components